MSQKIDLRIQRTRRNIQDAFIHLVTEHGFDALTVQMMADQAQINRATFYRHYIDKYDLAEQVGIALFEMAAQPHDDPFLQIRHMFDCIAEYAPFYQAVMKTRTIPNFIEQMFSRLEAGIEAHYVKMGFGGNKSKMPSALAFRYMATAQIGFVQWWIENEMPFSAAQAANYLLELHFHGPSWAIGIDNSFQGSVS
ncbi:MAG: TetR/AcrR family transcriptional regulator [Chloroflexota bacterium]